MNEIQESQRLIDLEILQGIEPAWAKAKLEPFLSSPQQDVQQPEWNKVQFDPTNFGITGSGNSGATITGIMVVDGVARYVDFVGTVGGTV